METKPLKNRKQIERNQKGQLQKGSILNPDGRPQGSKSFTTLMDEAVEEISKANNISKGEVWQILIKRGYSEAKDGNYPFYKDLLDRYFGKAHDVFEGDPNNPLIVEISEIIAKKRGIKRNENKKE